MNRSEMRRGGDRGNVAFVLVQAMVLMMLQQQACAIDCVDIVADCGAKADNSTDDTAAFAVCQTLASKHSGCITVPAGLYRITAVQLNTSHIDISVDNEAVFLPWSGSDGVDSGLLQPWSDSAATSGLFVIGTPDPKASEYVQNVSLHGQAPGMFTIDVSVALYTPWRARGVSFLGGIKNLLLSNMLCKMANPRRNPKTQYRSENPCIAFNYETFNGERLNPQDGTLHNLSCTGCVSGYGLMQMHSAERMDVQNLFSEGGVTLHLETGGLVGGYLGEVYGKNLTCKDGEGVIVSEPHIQQNGAYHLEDLLALGCNDVIVLSGGYSQHGYPPGHFSNASSIANITGVYGTHAQNSSLDIDVPSCAPCTMQNSPLNYHVTLSGIKAIGFPPPSNRTECIYYKRNAGGCPYSH